MIWKWTRRLILFTLLFGLYLASTVPVGLFLYSLKSRRGINIFAPGGFHTYMRCLQQSFPLQQFERPWPHPWQPQGTEEGSVPLH